MKARKSLLSPNETDSTRDSLYIRKVAVSHLLRTLEEYARVTPKPPQSATNWQDRKVRALQA